MAEYVIVLTNAFTKFTFPVPKGYQPTSTVVKTLVYDWFLVYGVHNHIHSDQGSCVAAEVMRGLCGTYGAKKSRISLTILKEMGNVTTLSMMCHAPLLLTRSDLSALHTMWRTIPLQGILPITWCLESILNWIILFISSSQWVRGPIKHQWWMAFPTPEPFALCSQVTSEQASRRDYSLRK